MEYVNLGKSGLKVSVIGLGTWQFGSRGWGWGKEFSKEHAVSTTRRALDMGINFVDTAEIYGGGTSEEVIGEAIRDRRKEVVIATKIWPTHLTPGGVRKAAERSLRRLNISEIELYQVHWPNPLVPIKSTMRAMEKLIEEGKIRNIGVSNFGLGALKRAQEALASHEIVSNQMHYSMLHRGVEKNLLPYCKRENISIIAYSPLAQGVLTGKYGSNRRSPGGVRVVNIHFSSINLKRSARLVETLRDIAAKKGKTVSQVALNWLLKEPNVIPIPGAKSPSQLEENTGAADWRLTSDDLATIGKSLQTYRPEYVLSALTMLPRALVSF